MFGLMRFSALPLLAFLLAAGPSALRAAECDSPASGEGLRLEAVSPQLDLFLSDGRRIHFPALEPPRASAFEPERPQSVAKEIKALLADKPLAVRPLGPPDRWGRVPARLFVAGESESLDETLAAAGLAMATAATAPCAEKVRAAEAEARAARVGLWADPAFAVLAADQPQDYSARAGALALAEGKVRSIGRTAPRLYLNLGARYGGLALTISRRNLPAFERAGLTEATLRDRNVRARGVLEIRTGPQIELFHPGQIEFMDETAPQAAGATNRN
jgi:hypothetical protein